MGIQLCQFLLYQKLSWSTSFHLQKAFSMSVLGTQLELIFIKLSFHVEYLVLTDMTICTSSIEPYNDFWCLWTHNLDSNNVSDIVLVNWQWHLYELSCSSSTSLSSFWASGSLWSSLSWLANKSSLLSLLEVIFILFNCNDPQNCEPSASKATSGRIFWCIIAILHRQ